MIYRKLEGCALRPGINWLYDKTKFKTLYGLFFMLPVWITPSKTIRYDDWIDREFPSRKIYKFHIGFKFYWKKRRLNLIWGKTTTLRGDREVFDYILEPKRLNLEGGIIDE